MLSKQAAKIDRTKVPNCIGSPFEERLAMAHWPDTISGASCAVSSNGQERLRLAFKMSLLKKNVLSQSLCSLNLCQTTIECAKWEVPSLPRQLQYQAVGKAERWPSAKEIERGSHQISILYRQALVVEHHPESSRKLSVAAVVHGCQHPHRLCKYYDGNPRSRFNESIG
jgi:hypothetical protein